MIGSLLVLGAVCLVPLAGCGHGGESVVKASTAPKPVPVTVALLERRSVERTVEVVGSLRGWEDVTIGAKKGGRVLRVLHDMGDHVRPRETLVELDPTDARLAISQARSKYLAELVRLGITQQQAEDALKRFGVTEDLLLGDEVSQLIERAPSIVQASVAVDKSNNTLNRQRNLYQRGASTVEELQNVENDNKAARAAKDNAVTTARNIIATAIASKLAIDAAEQGLKDMTVLAPEPSRMPEGLDRNKLKFGVSKRSVSEGQILRDGDAVMELVIENPLRLWANVPERFSGDIQIGQPAEVTVSSHRGTGFEGKVARINPTVDSVSRTFQVEVAVPNDKGMLRPGGFAKASIQTSRTARAAVVPLESVVRYAGVTKVFVVEGSKVRSIPVETALEDKGWVEVIGDLPETAQVVTTGQTQLADGTSIVIHDPKADGSKSNPSG